MLMGRNALYYEDYVLAIQRFNMVINAKPYLHEPYFFRGLAKFYLEDFAGAVQDCSESIDLNPYVADNYQLRGLCRVNMKDYEGAIVDYRRVISMEPKNRPSWHNLVLCYFELKQYAQADSALDQMIRYWPHDAENLTMKAQVAIQQADTVRGLALVDSALVVDAYDAQAWTMRSMISLNRGEYAQAESEIDKAIIQRPRVAGNYINRALARYHQNNLRGAMTDYDQALEIDPRNYLGHFNRGLMRAQVGDDNRAIEDFDFVLSVEPDNMIALFNRALLLDQTGDYRAALRDISRVLEEYPDFLVGYQQRAAIRRKIGDSYGAERDEFRVLKARLDSRAGIKHHATKTRKKSAHNIEDYASIVEDDTDEPEREYASDYRGRVQDRRVEELPQSIVVLARHSRQSVTNRYKPFHRCVDDLNSQLAQGIALCLTTTEPQLDAAQLQLHFTSIELTSQQIEQAAAPSASLYISRAIDYYHVRDFESALADLGRAEVLAPKDAIVPFVMAQVRCRQMEAQSGGVDATATSVRIGYQRAIDDFKRAIDLASDFAYAWYNIGCIQMALHDYGDARKSFSKALNAEPRFPEAYFNRGLACILDGQTQLGLSDLSQAGEYGIYSAYNLIKRYSKDRK
ncbi:MAG: tetratricopeptide repeat protein [Bacteroidaceae bacterium]|nr:tetratricopeptide repeat protein [Bacteroidaceae bacterium]